MGQLRCVQPGATSSIGTKPSMPAEGRHQGSAADGGQLPRGRWEERAMFFFVLGVIVAVVVIVALPRMRRKR